MERPKLAPKPNKVSVSNPLITRHYRMLMYLTYE